MKTLFLVCCAVLTFVPAIFIWNRVYQDGIVGRTALSGISFFSALYLIKWMDGECEPVTLQMLMFHASVAAFLIWHLWRFHRRVLQGKKPPYCPPECPEDRRHNPDRRFIAQ